MRASRPPSRASRPRDFWERRGAGRLAARARTPAHLDDSDGRSCYSSSSRRVRTPLLPANLEKRKYRRIEFSDPLIANLSARLVRLIDLSTAGAGIEHPFALGIGKRRRLEFVCEGERIVLDSEIVRSRLERGGEELVFRSGLRFLGESEGLWGLVASLAVDAAREE